MRTEKEAKAEVIARLDEYSRRIKEDPSYTSQWIDQAYGFTMGVSYCCSERTQDDIGAIWNEWYRQNNPAYK